MQGTKTIQTQNVSNVVFYIDLDKYGEVRIRGREWWEEAWYENSAGEKRREWVPVREVIIIKRDNEDKIEEKEEVKYIENKPAEKTVYRIIRTKKYIIFDDIDDAVNLRIENAKFVDELQKDAETIEVPLTIDYDGYHIVDIDDFVDELTKYFTKKYGNVCNIFNDDCELKEEVKEKLSEVDREIYDFIYNHLCDIYDYECDS